MPALRFNLPISWAAWARWLNNCTSLPSSSSIFVRQSEISMRASRSAIDLQWSLSRRFVCHIPLPPVRIACRVRLLAYRANSMRDRRRRTTERLRAAHKLCHTLHFFAGLRSIVCTIALPTTAASAELPTASNCSALEMPKPSATGSLVYFRNAAPARERLRADSGARRSRRYGHRVHKSAGCPGNPLQSLFSAGGSGQEHGRELPFRISDS